MNIYILSYKRFDCLLYRFDITNCHINNSKLDKIDKSIEDIILDYQYLAIEIEVHCSCWFEGIDFEKREKVNYC